MLDTSCTSLHEKLDGYADLYAHARAVFSENGKEVGMGDVKGNKSYCVAELERIIPPDQGRRPDLLVRVCDDARYYFVELKGMGIPARDAVDQIVAGIQLVRNRGVVMNKQQIYGIIVGSRLPGGGGWRSLQDSFLKKHGRALRREAFSYTILLREN